MVLSLHKKEKYIDSGGVKCPYCGSKDMTCYPLQADGGYVWHNITCDKCSKQWKDVYKLVNIYV